MGVHKITTEEELVSGLKNKDENAFQTLNDKYSDNLQGIASKLVPVDDTEDVLQEVLIKVYRSVHAYDSTKGSLFTWLMRLTKYQSIDVLKSKSYRNSCQNMEIEGAGSMIDAKNWTTFNTDTIGMREFVANLKPEWQIVIGMVYFHGYTHTEAAKALNLPLGTVKSRIRLAVDELRKLYNIPKLGNG